jgi:hypothetical protein
MNLASSQVNFFQDNEIGSNYTQSRRPVKDVFAARDAISPPVVLVCASFHGPGLLPFFEPYVISGSAAGLWTT